MMKRNIVFVLGAGFTRAFLPAAPLLVDDYGIADLAIRFAGFPWATSVLGSAREETTNRVDIEQLLTRLCGMPYDNDDARHEMALLSTELRAGLLRRIRAAKSHEVSRDALARFARFVISSRASIVTFNYDDVLDQALWEVHRVIGHHNEPYWHPDGGYGFFCRPSSVCVNDHPVYMDRPASLLFKLHGSVNWRSRLGESELRGPSALLHHEEWLPKGGSVHVAYDDSHISAHLEKDPFVVPPILLKTELDRHPVLRMVWSGAFKKLSEANEVVFIGYSLPLTDMAARTLFREALSRKDVLIRVVNQTADGKPDEDLKRSYRLSIGDIPNDRFSFSGALPVISSDFSS